MKIPEYKYCQRFLTTTMSDEKIAEKINEEYKVYIQNKKEEKKENSIWKNLIIGIGILVLIGGLVLGGYVVYKKYISKKEFQKKLKNFWQKLSQEIKKVFDKGGNNEKK